MSRQATLPGFDEAPSPSPRRIKPPEGGLYGLFLALLPTPDQLPGIEQAASPLRRRHGTARGRVEGGRLHVTCCDLGGFQEPPRQEVLDAVIAVAAGVQQDAFEIVFDRVLRSERGQALLLVEREGSTPLTAFRDALDQALVRAGVPVRKPGTAHMTLGYGEGSVSEALAEPVRWTAQALVLVLSLVGRHEHRHLGRWPLRPPR